MYLNFSIQSFPKWEILSVILSDNLSDIFSSSSDTGKEDERYYTINLSIYNFYIPT